MKKTLIYCAAVISTLTYAERTEAAVLSERLETVVENTRPLELPQALTAALVAIESEDTRAEQSGLLGALLAEERPSIVTSVAKTLVSLDVKAAVEMGASASKVAPRLGRDSFEALITAVPDQGATVFEAFLKATPEFAAAYLAIASQAPAETLFAIADSLSQMESGRQFRGQVLGDWIADRIDSKLDAVDKRNRILDQLIVFQSKVRLVQERYASFTEETRRSLGVNSFGNMAELIATQVIQVNLFDQGGESIETAFLEPETLVAPAFVSEVPSNQIPPFVASELLQDIADQIFQSARTSNTLVNPNAATTVTRPDRQLSRDPATNVAP